MNTTKSSTPTHDYQREYYDEKYQLHTQWSKFKLLKREKRLEWILPYIKPTDEVVDIGCGLGYITYRISRKCKRTTGVDISEKGIALANKQYGDEKCSFINRDILEFKGSRLVNVAVMIELIEHLEDPKQILKKLYDLLDDNDGRIIITTPRGDRLTNRIRCLFGLSKRIDEYHVQEYNQEEMNMLLCSAGFECVEIKFAGMDLPFPSRFRFTKWLRQVICENEFGWRFGSIMPFFSNSLFFLACKRRS